MGTTGKPMESERTSGRSRRRPSVGQRAQEGRYALQKLRKVDVAPLLNRGDTTVWRLFKLPHAPKPDGLGLFDRDEVLRFAAGLTPEDRRKARAYRARAMAEPPSADRPSESGDCAGGIPSAIPTPATVSSEPLNPPGSGAKQLPRPRRARKARTE